MTAPALPGTFGLELLEHELAQAIPCDWAALMSRRPEPCDRPAVLILSCLRLCAHGQLFPRDPGEPTEFLLCCEHMREFVAWASGPDVRCMACGCPPLELAHSFATPIRAIREAP